MTFLRSKARKQLSQDLNQSFLTPELGPTEFNKYLLSACYVQDFVSGTWDTSENKTKVPALMELTV